MISTLNIKAICPQITREPSAVLSYDSVERAVTLWVGPDEDSGEGLWEQHIPQGRQKKFEVPGVPYLFIIVSGKLYYRPLGD